MKISVIGGGTIGASIAERLQAKGFEVTVTRRSTGKLAELAQKNIRVTSDNISASKGADVVIIALKPKDTLRVLPEIAIHLKDKLLISMVAAIKESNLKKMAGEAVVVRAMTNIAAKVGGGYTVYCSKDLTEYSERSIQDIFSAFGDYDRVEEKYMDALTAISGSGPAYIFTIIEAMVYAGLKVGLPRDLSLRSSYETILGSAKLVAETGYHPSELRDLVTTPGGVTIDALYELEDSGIRTAFMRAIEAATKKAKIISDSLFEEIQ